MTYISKLASTGALTKTPRRIIRQIGDLADDTNAPIRILELGAGKGEITKSLIAKFSNRIEEYLAVEISAEFSEKLRHQYPMVKVVNDNALKFTGYISQPPNIIISSVPISFFEKSEQNQFIKQLKDSLAPMGKLIILFHAVWLCKRFKNLLPDSRIESYFHIPPYFLLSYQKPGI